MRASVLSSLLLGSLSVLAYTGTGCEDPYEYHIYGERCVANPYGGYVKTPADWTDGGCSTSHMTSAYQCEVKSAIDNYDRVKVEGPYENIAGVNVYASCEPDTPGSVIGIKYGKSNPDAPCDYCRFDHR